MASARRENINKLGKTTRCYRLLLVARQVVVEGEGPAFARVDLHLHLVQAREPQPDRRPQLAPDSQ